MNQYIDYTMANTVQISQHQRRVWQFSGYEISAAIHCKPLQLFARQQLIYVSG